MPTSTYCGLSAGLLLPGEAPGAAQLAAVLPPELYRQLCWVAADGGCRYAERYGLELKAIIGDFDSCPQEIQQRADQLADQQRSSAPNPQQRSSAPNPDSQALLLKADVAKDESDRNLALEYLSEHGHRHIVQVGGGGGRSDHFLAMIYDYQLRRSDVLPELWLTGHEAIFYLEAGRQLVLSSDIAETLLLSSFPLSADTTLKSFGLRWPLDAVRLDRNVSVRQAVSRVGGQLPYSLSNWAERQEGRQMGKQRIAIEAQGGAALIFLPYPGSSLEKPTEIRFQMGPNPL